MADIRVLIYSVMGFLVGISLFLKGFKWLKTKRLIENIPTSKIRSLAMGLVEIYGEVVPAKNKILKSPFSNSDCVYYKYTTEEYRSSGKSSRWVITKYGSDMTHFYLKDNTSSVLVDPKNAKIDVPMDNQFNSSLGKDPPKIVMNFLKANKTSFEGIFGMNKKMRFREYFIAPKDKLYILGSAGDNPFVNEATAKHGVEDVMIQKGKNEKIYYISDKHEATVLDSFKKKVIWGIYGGGALIVICLTIILIYFGLF